MTRRRVAELRQTEDRTATDDLARHIHISTRYAACAAKRRRVPPQGLPLFESKPDRGRYETKSAKAQPAIEHSAPSALYCRQRPDLNSTTNRAAAPKPPRPYLA